jgi:hypothetical protein
VPLARLFIKDKLDKYSNFWYINIYNYSFSEPQGLPKPQNSTGKKFKRFGVVAMMVSMLFGGQPGLEIQKDAVTVKYEMKLPEHQEQETSVEVARKESNPEA